MASRRSSLWLRLLPWLAAPPPLPPACRPGAAQTCVQKQDHGLETGLDGHLIQVCQAALPDVGSSAKPQAVYAECQVVNTHR